MTQVRSSGSLEIPATPFSEEEQTSLLNAIKAKLDTPFSRSEKPLKNLVVDLFGPINTGKNSVSEELERAMRREKLNVIYIRESADHPVIRAENAPDPVVYQAQHLAIVDGQVMFNAYDPNWHAVIVNRGRIDMLFWYEKYKKNFSEQHLANTREFIYERLRMDQVDAYLFLEGDPEVLLERSYKQAVTKQQGTHANIEAIRESIGIYEKILADVEENVPGLPIFRIDTTEISVMETTQEALRFILPTLCARYEIPGSSYLPKSPALLRRTAQQAPTVDEQLKLHGTPSVGWEAREDLGWKLEAVLRQRDTLLDSRDEDAAPEGGAEFIQVRAEWRAPELVNGSMWEGEPDSWFFAFKDASSDGTFSRRPTVKFSVSADEAEDIIARYRVIGTVTKQRDLWAKTVTLPDGSTQDFWLHVDRVEELGAFTEIKTHGTQSKQHWRELLALANELGFGLSDIAPESYLSMLLEQKNDQ